MSKLRDALLCVFFAACICAACFFSGVNWQKKRDSGHYTERVDTLYLRDTITRVEPVYIAVEPEIRTDTLRVHDSIFIPVPIERRVYADSNYRAVVSGWHPSLDTISVYPETRVITIERTRTEWKTARWGLALQAGAGISAKGAIFPYIGVGVSYNLLSLER